LGNSNLGRVILVLGLVAAGAYVVYKIIERGGRLIVRSLTPDEMKDILIGKYKEFAGKYFSVLRWAKGVGSEEDEAVVKELLTNYYYHKFIESTGDEAKAWEEARESAEEEMRSGDRMGVVEKVKDMIGYPPSLLFIGPPGVGKSETVREVARILAEEFGLEFVDYRGIEDLRRIEADPTRYFVYVDLRLTSLEPADITGIPRTLEGDISEYLPFGWAKALSLSPGILNLEELTNVDRPDLLSAAYQLVLDHRAGFLKFNPAVMVVALGNPSEWSAVAHELPTPLLNRFEVFNVIAPTPDEWIRYMWRKYGKGWYWRIGDFLRVAPQNMLPSEEEARNVGLSPESQIPTPRSWTKLAVQLFRDFEDKGETPEDVVFYIDKIMARIQGVGSCADVVAKVPGSKDYDSEAKRVCEEMRGTVGTAATERFVTVVGKVYRDPEEFMKSFDDFKKYWDELWDWVESEAPNKSVAREIVCTVVPRNVSYWIEKRYRMGEKEGVGNKYVKENVDLIARVVDEIAKKCGNAPAALAVGAICNRKDMGVKELLYERSEHVKKAVEEYIERVIGRVRRKGASS